MITLKTKSGFKAEVEPRKVVDFRFLEYVVEVSKGKTDLDKLNSYIAMIKFLFSNEDKERFIEHIASLDKDGIAEVTSIAKELEEIMTICAEENKKVKNS